MKFAVVFSLLCATSMPCYAQTLSIQNGYYNNSLTSYSAVPLRLECDGFLTGPVTIKKTDGTVVFNIPEGMTLRATCNKPSITFGSGYLDYSSKP